MSRAATVTAFAPASIGNVGVGFDMLGLAIAGVGDRVTATAVDEPGVRIREVRGPDGATHPVLPANPDENTASIAAGSLWKAAGEARGLELFIRKGIPLQSGMGSSAASAVAGAVAANALLDKSLDTDEVLMHALAGERFASGGLHADNVAPSLVGGLVLCPPALLPTLVQLPVPAGLCSVLVHPELEVNTAESRRGLAQDVAMKQWLDQQGYLAGFVAGCLSGQVELLARCLRDVIIEPQRAASVPVFAAVRDAAMTTGALGCSLSGSGPSIFAICRELAADDVAAAMAHSCRAQGVACQHWISPLDAPGASLERAA